MRTPEQDLITHPADKERMRHDFYVIEQYRDFLEWLFEHEIDWLTQSEAWEKFQQFQETQPKNLNPMSQIKGNESLLSLY